jgi:transposase-like protein
VRWYLRYGLSYRDVDELLAERNIQVDHVTVFRRVQRFTPLLSGAARPCRHARSGGLHSVSIKSFHDNPS